MPIIDSFEYVAREWHEKFKAKCTDDHARRLLTRLEHDVSLFLGKCLIDQIDALELLEVMQRMEARGVIDTSRRAFQNCGQIFRYGMLRWRCALGLSSVCEAP